MTISVHKHNVDEIPQRFDHDIKSDISQLQRTLLDAATWYKALTIACKPALQTFTPLWTLHEMEECAVLMRVLSVQLCACRGSPGEHAGSPLTSPISTRSALPLRLAPG